MDFYHLTKDRMGIDVLRAVHVNGEPGRGDKKSVACLMYTLITPNMLVPTKYQLQDTRAR